MDKVSEEIEEMTILQLKEHLRKRGAKLSGRKRDLVERLESYIRNDNFGQAGGDASEEFNMSIPDITTFKDVNSDCKLPAFPFKHIETYLDPLGKLFDKKPKDLYDGGYLKFVRYAFSGSVCFFRTICRAEMKKNLTYIVDVSVDSFGCVVQCQCECGAGMGPEANCKHVCTLLYAINQFHEKRAIKTEETCTQKLQTFHKTKRFVASPIKSFHLNLTGRDKTDYRFDPRKPKYVDAQQTNARIQSVVKNQKDFGQMPISQLYEPCDIEAYAHDHMYFEKTNEDSFLDDASVTDITDSQIIEVEIATRKQALCKRWHEERCKRLQASKFGQICKATERTNFPMLARSFTKSNKISSAPLKHGRKYEPVAITEYEKLMKCKVKKSGIVINKLKPYLGCSPDGVVADRLVECKCPFTAKNKKICPVSVPYLYERDGVLCLKNTHDYYYQIQGQMYCTGKPTCDLCIFTLCDLKVISIARDDKFITTMLARLQSFFEQYFRKAILDAFYYKYSNMYF